MNNSYISEWISYLIHYGVQELDLTRFNGRSFWSVGIYELPHCVLSCQSLKVLKLNLEGRRFKEPSGVFASLEVLCFEEARVSDRCVRIWTCTTGPAPKVLVLRKIEYCKCLDINNSSLEEVIVQGRNFYNVRISTEKLVKLSLLFPPRIVVQGIEIIAPSVQSFAWSYQILDWCGGHEKLLNFGTFISLQDVNLDVKLKMVMNGECKKSYFADLLQRLRFARNLEINIGILKGAISSQSNMLILQKSCTYSMGNFVIYASVDVAMNVVLNGEDPVYVALLPSELVLDLGGAGNTMPVIDDYVYELPGCVFSCQSLRILKLKMSDSQLKEPSGTFVSLEVLCLEEAEVSNDSARIWTCSSTCPALKVLVLKNISECRLLDINHPSLEEVTIQGCIDGTYYRIFTEKLARLSFLFPSSSKVPGIEIFAPNLQAFLFRYLAYYWSEEQSGVLNLGTFNSLQDVNLHIKHRITYYGDEDDTTVQSF
ncbi:Homeobox leucine zipper protein [Quillaja saponaria]|uniref:Homeobox leucine zipper protein n=1 Tax=Quillaja saponaria TaxID=32244 RepID=A0AAD7QH82_QUISA|nr:Homeobox leucine zipper protein [Quillaja saponaria]